MLSDEKANLLATVSFIRENCFTLEFYALEKSNSRFAVVNLPAGQYHIQKLHSLIDEDSWCSYRHATTRLLALSNPSRHSDALYRKWNQAQARLPSFRRH